MFLLPESIKGIRLKQPRKDGNTIFHIVSLDVLKAVNSILCGPIWSKFELLLDIMRVVNTYKFKMDHINSNRDKGSNIDFRRTRAANSVVGSGQISNSYKLLCMSLLPASMKRILSRTAENQRTNGPVNAHRYIGLVKYKTWKYMVKK